MPKVQEFSRVYLPLTKNKRRVYQWDISSLQEGPLEIYGPVMDLGGGRL